MVESGGSVDGRQLEQLKAALLQQIQKQQRRDPVLPPDDRRTPADRLPTEFEMRERQRQEEIRRRQVSRHAVTLWFLSMVPAPPGIVFVKFP